MPPLSRHKPILLNESGTYRTLQEAFGFPENVRSLFIPDFGMKSLPKEMAQFTELEFLDITGNKLENLPSGFSELQQLKVVEAEANAFLLIPHALLQLPNLESLNFTANNFTQPTDGLEQLRHLKKLNLTGNPIQSWQKQRFVEILPETEINFGRGDVYRPGEFYRPDQSEEPKIWRMINWKWVFVSIVGFLCLVAVLVWSYMGF